MGAGLTALAAIGFVVYEHFKKHNENLDELINKSLEARNKTDELKDALGKFDGKVQDLPPHLRKLQEAVEDLDRIQTESLRKTETQKLEKMRIDKAAIEAQIESIREQLQADSHMSDQRKAEIEASGDAAAATDFYSDKIKSLTTESKKLDDQIKILTADTVSHGRGAKGAADEANKLAEAQAKAAEEAKKSDQVIGDALKSLAQKTKVLADEEAEATGSSLEKRKAAAQKFYDEQAFTINKEYDRAITAANGNKDKILQIEAAKSNAMNQLATTTAAKQDEMALEIGKSFQKAGVGIEQGIGDAFAKSIIEGKSFEESMKQMSIRIAEQVIADLVRIEIQALITSTAVKTAVLL